MIRRFLRRFSDDRDLIGVKLALLFAAYLLAICAGLVER